MKKIIALLLILVLCMATLSSCILPGVTGGADAESILADAETMLNSLYKKDNGKETKNDYDVVATIKVAGTTEVAITWAVDNSAIKITKNGSFYTVDLPAENAEETPYTLTATLTYSGKTKEIKYNRVLPVYEANAGVGGDINTEDTYKMTMEQQNLGQVLYALASDDGQYILSTTDPKAAADIKIEASGDGYKFYTTTSDGAKKYINPYLVSEDGETYPSRHLVWADSTEAVWTYNKTLNAWFTTLESESYTIGTWSSYTTFSLTQGKHMTAAATGVSQFPGNFIEKSVAEALEPVTGGDVTIYTTPAEIMAAASELAAGQYLSNMHKYTLTGVITSIDYAYDASYGNISFTMTVEGTEASIYAYRTYGDLGATVAVGDTVTITGVIMKYQPTSGDAKIEMEKGSFSSGSSTGGNAGTSVSAPEADTEYYFYVNQVTLGKTLYAIGATQDNEGKFVVTTETAADAASFYAEAVTGGYKFYTTINGTKMYLNGSTTTSGTKISKFLSFAESSDSVWYYKADCNAWYVTIDGAEYVLGTYGTYATLSLSDSSYMTSASSGVSQFPGNLILASDVEAGEEGGETPETPAEPAEKTIEEFNAIANALGTTNGAATTEKYIVTGTIESIANTTYGNMTIVDAAGNSLYIYGTWSADGSLKYGEMDTADQPQVGDTITVVGVASYFNGVQMKNGWITSITAGEGGEGNEGGDDTPVTPAEPTEKTIPEFKAIATALGKNGAATTEKYIVTGVITSITQTTYGNLYIEDADGNSLYIYGLYDATGENQFDAMNPQPKVGDTITVVGVASYYDGAQMKNGWVTELVEGNYVPPVDTSAATITFDDLANRSVWTADQQVWALNGITVTNDKASSTSNCNGSNASNPDGYYNPVRFYKNSNVTIAYTSVMTKIEITCGTESYASDLAATAASSGTVTVDGVVVTITFDTAVDTVTFTTLSGQTRVSEIKVYVD